MKWGNDSQGSDQWWRRNQMNDEIIQGYSQKTKIQSKANHDQAKSIYYYSKHTLD